MGKFPRFWVPTALAFTIRRSHYSRKAHTVGLGTFGKIAGFSSRSALSRQSLCNELSCLPEFDVLFTAFDQFARSVARLGG